MESSAWLMSSIVSKRNTCRHLFIVLLRLSHFNIVARAVANVPPLLIGVAGVAVVVSGQIATSVKFSAKLDAANEANMAANETNMAAITAANAKLDMLTVRFDVIGYVVAAIIALSSAGSSIVKVLEYFNIRP